MKSKRKTATILHVRKHQTSGGPVALVESPGIGYVVVGVEGSIKRGDHLFGYFDQGLLDETIDTDAGSTIIIRVFSGDTDLVRAQDLLRNYSAEAKMT